MKFQDEKTATEHVEDVSRLTAPEQIHGFDADADTVPDGYFHSPRYWGSMLAIPMSFESSIGAFALPAPILGTINADIGPSPNIAWVALLSVCLPLHAVPMSSAVDAVHALYSHKNSPAIRRILMCAASQASGGCLSEKIGTLRIRLIIACGVGTVFLGSLAALGPDSQNAALALIICGTYAFGWNEGVTQTLVGICVHDQKEIGIAVGIVGSIRSTISTIWIAVFVSVLGNRQKTTIPNNVGSAVVKAGLPASSVPDLLEAFASGLPSTPRLFPASYQPSRK